MLEAMVGIGNVRAEVYADVDPQREVISEERYDPEGQVLRSSQSVTESSQYLYINSRLQYVPSNKALTCNANAL